MNTLEKVKTWLQSRKIVELRATIADLEMQLRHERTERDEEVTQLIQRHRCSKEMLTAEIDNKNKLLKDLAASLEQVHKQIERLVAK
jgi:chromosome segregation ATPase